MSSPQGRSSRPAVLLLSPGIIKWTDLDFGLPHLVALGGYLERELGVRVEILDLAYEGGDHHELLRTIEALGPFVLIGVSCYSSYDYMRVIALGRFLKAALPQTPLVTGGYHVSARPQEMLPPMGPFAAAVMGEGERPMKRLVETVLGGGRLEGRIFEQDNVEDLDSLPTYRWELLARYWPRATSLGRKLQVYLSRGCTYRCTFCMERAKTEYQWRAFSPDRAVHELDRLSKFTKLDQWIVNIADPLFGFHRDWRRQVLEGILQKRLLPRQYWTLTRSDDLQDHDVALLAKARFSIGIGAESASPRMLGIMNKTRNPETYLAALERLSVLSLKHGLNWAANIIVGHPGETKASILETRDFMERLLTSAGQTCGWLSFDPFRMYPGSKVDEEMSQYSARFGTVFHHPRWWTHWHDTPFRAEHVDPSAELDYESRVRVMYDSFGPLAQEIAGKFKGQGRSVDRVFERSLEEQVRLMSPEMRDRLIARSRRAKAEGPSLGSPRVGLVVLGQARGATRHPVEVDVPLGINVRDPNVRRREEAIRRLLEEGVLRSHALIEALLEVAPGEYLPEDAVTRLLSDFPDQPPEGDPPQWLGLRTYVMSLEALEPQAGNRAADFCAAAGYVSALLRCLVGAEGSVVTVDPRHEGVDVTVGRGAQGPFDVAILGGAVPRRPSELLSRLDPLGGKLVTLIGPRFRAQDLVCLTRSGDVTTERVLARVRAPVLRGREGWLGA